MRTSLRVLLLAAGVVSGVAGSGGRAGAAFIFNNFDPGGFETNRSAQSSPGALIQVSQTTTITGIGVLNRLSTAGNLKFLIFDNSTSALLFATGPKAFAADAGVATFKDSDALSFTLLAGRRYDIGAIADVPGLWDVDFTANTQNGLTSVTNNANFINFAAPAEEGRGGTDSIIRLSGPDAVTTATPAPAGALVLAAAAGLLGLARRFRVSAA